LRLDVAPSEREIFDHASGGARVIISADTELWDAAGRPKGDRTICRLPSAVAANSGRLIRMRCLSPTSRNSPTRSRLEALR
jgi:hypothetical protein